ncbi:MAG: hypothetical protein U0105_13725 [Candidatus Obscuribacterales bacterium]
MRIRSFCVTLLSLAGILIIAPAALSYPEFQQFCEKHSGRTVNCAMCHINAHGPSGSEPGQVGALNPEEMKRLAAARAALEPGQPVDSPILNKFGNRIMQTLGKKKVLEARTDPAKLASFLGNESDLDEDGIPDSKEFVDGTDSLNPNHGDPAELLFINLKRYAPHVLLAAAAIFLLDFGFTRVLKGFQLKARRSESAETGEET